MVLGHGERDLRLRDLSTRGYFFGGGSLQKGAFSSVLRDGTALEKDHGIARGTLHRT